MGRKEKKKKEKRGGKEIAVNLASRLCSRIDPQGQGFVITPRSGRKGGGKKGEKGVKPVLPIPFFQSRVSAWRRRKKGEERGSSVLLFAPRPLFSPKEKRGRRGKKEEGRGKDRNSSELYDLSAFNCADFWGRVVRPDRGWGGGGKKGGWPKALAYDEGASSPSRVEREVLVRLGTRDRRKEKKEEGRGGGGKPAPIAFPPKNEFSGRSGEGKKREKRLLP